MAVLYRKRLIPNEMIELKEDKIAFRDENYVITQWNTLHPKSEFSHGVSIYCIQEGWKISRFFDNNNQQIYIYCDIIDTSYDASCDTYIFTDLLADVIIENSGFVRVVDLDELADAHKQGSITNDMLVSALYKLNTLLSLIYNNHIQPFINRLEQHSNIDM